MAEFSNRRLGQPVDFDARLPSIDPADCDELSGDQSVAPLPLRLTIADLERGGMAAGDLDDPQVMRRAWGDEREYRVKPS